MADNRPIPIIGASLDTCLGWRRCRTTSTPTGCHGLKQLIWLRTDHSRECWSLLVIQAKDEDGTAASRGYRGGSPTAIRPSDPALCGSCPL